MHTMFSGDFEEEGEEEDGSDDSNAVNYDSDASGEGEPPMTAAEEGAQVKVCLPARNPSYQQFVFIS